MIRAEYNRLFDLRLTILKALDRCAEIARNLPSLTSGSSRFRESATATATLMTLGQKHGHCFFLLQATNCMSVAICR